MALFCKLFGHRFNPDNYGTLYGSYADGSRIHTAVFMECDRCHWGAQVCKVHVPKATVQALNLNDPGVEEYIRNYYHNKLEEAKFDAEYAEPEPEPEPIEEMLSTTVNDLVEPAPVEIKTEAPPKKPRKPRQKKTT